LSRLSKKSLVVPVVPASPVTEPLLYDIKTAARALNSTVWAVRSLLWSKEIPFVKIGRRFLIDPADLKAWIERQKGVAA